MRSRIVRDRSLEKWAAGLNEMDQPDAADRALWEQVTEVFFGRTQEAVHVLTGELKASGRQTTSVEGDRIIGEVTYDAGHAAYEFRRGGSHDAMARGYEVTARMFQGTLGVILQKKVKRWD